MSAPILGGQHRITRRLGKTCPWTVGANRSQGTWRLWMVESVERRALLGAINEAESVDGRDSVLRTVFRGRGDLNFIRICWINTFWRPQTFSTPTSQSMAASLEVRVPFMDLESCDWRLGFRRDSNCMGRRQNTF